MTRMFLRQLRQTGSKATGSTWTGSVTLLARLALLAFGALLSAPSVARGDVVDEAWKRGNEALLQGQYDAAAAAYEQLDRQGVVAADLYYNLGNAYFRQGSLGRAIWAYERAAALEPENDDARFNLQQARKLAADKARDRIDGVEQEPLWIRVVTALPTSTETWAFLSFYFATFLCLALRRRTQGDKRLSLGVLAGLLGFFALGFGGLLVGRAVLDRIPFAIILPESVAVKEGADPNHRTNFELHAGLKVRLLDRDHDWVRIRLPNGLEGWLRADEVGPL